MIAGWKRLGSTAMESMESKCWAPIYFPRTFCEKRSDLNMRSRYFVRTPKIRCIFWKCRLIRSFVRDHWLTNGDLFAANCLRTWWEMFQKKSWLCRKWSAWSKSSKATSSKCKVLFEQTRVRPAFRWSRQGRCWLSCQNRCWSREKMRTRALTLFNILNVTWLSFDLGTTMLVRILKCL